MKRLASASGAMPMPWSLTAMRRRAWHSASGSGSLSSVMVISPFSLNFTALDSRFTSTWRSRVGSTSTGGGSARRITCRSMPLAAAPPRSNCATSPTSSCTLQGSGSSAILPASSLE